VRRLLISALFAALFIVLSGQPTYALGLKVAPLEYKAMLADGERKQGFIDISNPSTQQVNVGVTVQAFKQINDDGGLQFYDDNQVQLGIKPDLDRLELGPREAIRVMFTVDGKNLPEGDVFAAIFFTTDLAQPKNGVGQLVRVGTIISLVNKNPGPRSAEVSKLSLPLLQLTDNVSGTYSIKNKGSADSGFYPTVEISSWPSGKPRKVESSLVFGGRERSNDFKYQTGYGIHLVQVGYGSSKKSQWVISIAPWMFVLLLLATLIIGIELLLLKKRRKSTKKPPHKKQPSTSEK